MKKILCRLKASATYWQSLANYAERGWGLLYSLILARVILPEEFGTFALGTSIALVSSLLTRWEIGNLIRVDPYYQGEGFGVAWAMTKALVYAELLVLGLVTAVCYGLSVPFEVCSVMLVYGFFTALDKFALLLRCDLEGKMQFRQNFKVKLIFTPLAAAVTIPMGLMGFGVWALLSSTWLGVLVNWFVFRKANPRPIVRERVGPELLRKIIKPSFWQWLCFVSQTLFVRGDKLMMGTLGSVAHTGFYNRAFNYAPLSFLGLGALAGNPATVAFSRMEESTAIWKYFRKRAMILVGAGVGFGILWLLWAELLVETLFGDNWLPAVPYFKAFSMFGAVQGIYYLSCSLMQGCRQYRMQGMINLGSIVVSAIFGSWVVRDGLVLAYLLQGSMLSAAVAMVFYMFRNLRCVKS